MSLETDLKAVIEPLCPSVFPDYAPNDTALPYVTWMQVGGSLISPLANTVPNKRCAFIQVNTHCATRVEATALALAIEEALITSNLFNARPNAAFTSTFDEVLEFRGTVQDFTIWAAR